MDKPERLFSEELEIKCKLAWIKFYRDLSPLISRTQPYDFARAMCRHVHDIEASKRQIDFAPHFAVALAIELNCVWVRAYYNEPVPLAKYRRIVRKIIEFKDPNDFHLLDNNFDLFTLKFFRRQIPFQHGPSRNAFYRIGQCLIYSPVLETVRDWFEETYGVTVKDWFKAGCIFLSTSFVGSKFENSNPVSVAEALNVPEEALKRVAEEAAITPEGIKQAWKNSREDAPYKEHFNISSVFHDRPIIDFGGGKYFVPFPKLLFSFLERRLQKIYKKHPKGGLKIGSAVERYVLEFLQSSGVASSVWNQADIKAKVEEGLSCDIVASLADCTLLIEVKATRFSREKLSSSTIQKDTSTGTIAKAYRQLIETAKSLYAENGETVETTHAVLGIVVTAWDIPSVNAPDYHNQYIHVADTTLWQSGDPPPEPFSYYPTTMDIGTFELLCEHIANGKSLLAFFKKREDKGYSAVGEWRDYLANISREDGYPPRLEVVQEEWNALFSVTKSH